MDLETATANRDAARTAWLIALKAQSASESDRRVTYQSVDMLYAQYLYWQKVVDKLTAQNAGVSQPLVAIAKWTR